MKSINPPSESTVIDLAIIGTRGIPARYGGFETYAENLSREMALLGYSVAVVTPSHRKSERMRETHRVIRWFVMDFEPKLTGRYAKAVSTIVYDFLSVIVCCIRRPRRVLICGYGAAPFFWLLNLAGVQYAVNPDGFEWRSKRWNQFARLWLQFCEFSCAASSPILIADANSIACRFKSKFRREAVVIPYGAQVAQEVALTRSDENIPNSSYYLAVARMVPETNIPLIIKGFLLSGTDADLLVIGPIKDQQFFDTEVAPLLGGKVKYLGSIYDSRRLGSLRAFSRALLHGHGSEGTNPSLVESLAYGSFLIAYDSESNRVVGGVDAKYFKTEKELANQIKTRDATSIEELSVIRRANIARAERDFSWGANARQHALALNLS